MLELVYAALIASFVTLCKVLAYFQSGERVCQNDPGWLCYLKIEVFLSGWFINN